MSTVYIDTKPKSKNLDDGTIQINGEIKIKPTEYSISIIQAIEVKSPSGNSSVMESEVVISRNLFDEIILRLDETQTVETEEEVLVPVAQKVIQADFSNKTFQKAYRVEKVSSTRQESTLNHGYFSVLFHTTEEGQPCLSIYDGPRGVMLLNSTFNKIVSKVREEDMKPKGKVLSFKKAS